MQHTPIAPMDEEKKMNAAFEPVTLAGDLYEVRRLYAEFFAGLHEEAWDKPAQRGSKEWTLHEAVAHQCALNGADASLPAILPNRPPHTHSCTKRD